METPIYTKLIEYIQKGRTSFAMPGHKNGRGLAPRLFGLDVTELEATADLRHESAEVRRANELLAELYGARESFIMTGGSTAGIQTMLASALKPGETLLAGADCHISVINTCALCGFKLRLIPEELDEEFCVPRGEGDFEIPRDVKAVLITSPNYYGIVKDIRRIAEKCRAAGAYLLVDEAHGAHFAGSDELPSSAVRLGADMVCQSAHKTLNALTGAAYLHICGERVDAARVRRNLRAFQTSSPSYPIAASADTAREELSRRRYADIIGECAAFRDAAAKATRLRVLENDDITRIVLCFSEYETTGTAAAKALSRDFGIDVEMADFFNIVLIAAPPNTHGDFMRLFDALCCICAGLPPRRAKAEIKPPPPPEGKINPGAAWFAETETVPLELAAGRISAAVSAVYPPGTAAVVTGAEITEEQINYLTAMREAGAEIAGLSDGGIEVVKWTE